MKIYVSSLFRGEHGEFSHLNDRAEEAGMWEVDEALEWGQLRISTEDGEYLVDMRDDRMHVTELEN